MILPDVKTAAVVAVIVGVGAFGGGYKVADWRLTGRYTAEKLEAAKGAAEALKTMTAARDQLSLALSAANNRKLDDLRKAQDETTRIRDRLYSGDIRLRINARCPEYPLGPKTAAGSGVDSGTGAELDTTARRAYFALRDGIDRASAQLAACQEELRLRTN